MKKKRNRNIFIVVSVFCMLFGGVQSVVAQLSDSGEWGAQTLSGTNTVTLKGNVTIKGRITIQNGVTLEINGGGKKISRGESFLGDLFYIDKGGKLEITNAIIDGNNEWTDDDDVDTEPTSNGVEAMGSMIEMSCSGSIFLTNVTLQNGWMKETSTTTMRSNGTAICISGTTENANGQAILEMTNCTIQKMYCTYNGSAIFANRTTNGGVFTIKNCTFKDNTIWYDKDAAGTSNDGNHGGTFRTQGGANATVTISGGSFENNKSNGQAGGIYWNAGEGSLTLKDNVVLKQNKAATYGGGIMVMTKMDLESATIENNQAAYGGGLAYRPFNSGSNASGYVDEDDKPFGQLTNASMMLSDKVFIRYNSATDKGGGIFIESGNIRFGTQAGDKDGEKLNEGESNEVVFRDEAASMELSIVGATIEENSAVNGGGIYMQSVKYGESEVDKNTKSGLKFSSGKVVKNTATNDGGGVYLKGIPINIEITDETSGITGNKATNGSGGGIYIDNTEKLLNQDLNVDLSGVVISDNAAPGTSGKGGGVYVLGSEKVTANVNCKKITLSGNIATGNGGGLYINGGNLNISEAGNEIKSNSAQNGGGVCIEQGTLAINQCDIKKNSATALGGGLFVSNSTQVAIDLTGNGNFSSNSAGVAGGGMAMQGPITLNFAGSLQQNTASNGGGIYLCNVANANQKTSLVFKGGFIRSNKANGSGNTATTGYQTTVSGLKGFGGGAFLDTNTQLSFDVTNELGFYGNEAVSGADDIFANGNNTSVALPDVSNMTLTDFEVPVDSKFLFWVKDYITSDTKYVESPEGVNEGNLSNGINVRYRDASTSPDLKYWKLNNNTYTEYISVALGYRLLYAEICKTGLKTGESAIFDVFKGNGSSTGKFASVVLTGTDESGTSVSKRIALTEGTWTVTETNWSWNYTTDKIENKNQSIEIKEGSNNKFIYTNSQKDTEKKKYDEKIKVNTMDKSLSNTD